MKILFKKLAIFLLVLNFIVLPLTACVPNNNGDGGGENDDGGSKVIENVTFEDTMFAYNGKEQSLLVSGDLPEGVTATYENNTHKEYGMYNAVCTLSGKGYKTKTLKAVMTIYYDDNDQYNESSYAYKNQLKDDSEILETWQKAGTFSNGQTEVLLLTQTDINDDSKTKAGIPTVNSSDAITGINYNISKTDADVYYKTTNELYVENAIEAPYTGNNGYLVLDSKINRNEDAGFSITPSCTKSQFAEADYLEFYMYFTSSSGTGKDTSFTLYVGNSKIYSSLLVNTWVQVRIPLEIYQSARFSALGKVKSKQELYDYLVAGNPFMWVRANFKAGGTQVFKGYFTDLKLKVSAPNKIKEGNLDNKSLSNNLTLLNEEDSFEVKGQKSLKNVYPRYLDNGLTVDNYDRFIQFGSLSPKLVRMDMAINSDNQKSKQTLINEMFVQVSTYKSYKQLEQYDALAVTMYVDTQNPHPLVARLGVPGPTGRIEYELARFSANKWVTFEIPIKDVLAIYPLIVNTGHYSVTGVGIRSNSTQELFSLTYEANRSDWIGDKIYASDLYSKRTEENGSVSTKWTEYPSRRSTHAPMMQGTWVQYPYTLYLKSLKLIKKADA